MCVKKSQWGQFYLMMTYTGNQKVVGSNQKKKDDSGVDTIAQA